MTGGARILTYLAVLLTLAAVGTASAQGNAASFKDWTVLPLPGQGCVLAQRLIAPEAGIFIGDVFLSETGAGGAILSLRVPLGVDLSQPAAYRLGQAGGAVPLIWQTCDAHTCLAQIEVTAAERARFAAMRQVTLAFRPTPDAPALQVPVSLMGVTAALCALAACG